MKITSHKAGPVRRFVQTTHRTIGDVGCGWESVGDQPIYIQFHMDDRFFTISMTKQETLTLIKNLQDYLDFEP